VDLWRCSETANPQCTWLKSATVSTDGNYWFAGVATLPANSWYQVVYYNTDKYWQYIGEWDARPLWSYTAGTYAQVPPFDITDVGLNIPWDEQVTLPVTFGWQPRDCVTGDTYVWYMYDPKKPETDYWELAEPISEHTFTMVELPEDATYNTQYMWGVRVENPAAGTGWSLTERSVIFLPPP
jgi:hypothetical protein